MFTIRQNFPKKKAVASLVKISRRNYAFRFIYPLILLVFGIVILILSLQNSDQYLSGSVFIVLAGLIAAYNAYCMIRLPHQVVKKNKELAEYGMVNEFTLKEESFSLVSKIGDQVSKYTAEYQQLKKSSKKTMSFCLWLVPPMFSLPRKTVSKRKKNWISFYTGFPNIKLK